MTGASSHVCVACRALQATPLNDFERACVSNLNPHSAEEAKALLPSLDVSDAFILEVCLSCLAVTFCVRLCCHCRDWQMRR